MCRQRARATVSRRDAGVVRRRAAVVSAPTAERNGRGALVSRLPQRRRAVVAGRWAGCRCTHATPQRCAPAKVGYERCRRTPKETPDRVSLHFRSASRQLASGCKDTRRGTIPRRVDVAGPGIGRGSSKAPSSSSSADPRPRRGGFTFPRWTRSRRRRGGFGRHGRSSSAPAAL